MVAVLAWLSPFNPIGASPFTGRQTQEAITNPSQRERELLTTVVALQTQISVGSGDAAQSVKVQPTSPSTNPRPSPIPTATPIPAPTPIPDTVPGTILEVGQTWRQGGLELRLIESELSIEGERGPGVLLWFRLTSLRPQSIPVRFSSENFSAANNRGQRLQLCYTNLYERCFSWNPLTVVLGSGDGIYLPSGNNDTGSHRIFVRSDIVDPAMTEIMVTVSGISSISNARWRIPIYH